MEKMRTRISGLQCAVLCTPDGFNICSLGLTEDQVGKLAALSSSLLSVGDATVASVEQVSGASASLETLSIEAMGLQIVGVKIARPGGKLILMAGARAPLGLVLVGVKTTASDLIKLF